MKAVAYSVKPFEKEFLAKANQKKHDITLISNDLSADTVIYAEGKDAVIVLNDDVNASLIERLADLGVKYIATRSAGVGRIDAAAAAARHIKIAAASYAAPQPVAELTAGPATETMQSIAYQIINHLDQWQNEQRARNDQACAKIGDLEELKEPIKHINHAG
jgi:lactate dehydrogenase-like 2-hydroxyacid dehydrogenase